MLAAMSIEKIVIHLGLPIKTNVCVLVAQSCPTLCDPMDCSSPSSNYHMTQQSHYWANSLEKNTHTHTHTILKDTCTPGFIAALFAKGSTWKQPR